MSCIFQYFLSHQSEGWKVCRFSKVLLVEMVLNKAEYNDKYLVWSSRRTYYTVLDSILSVACA